MVLILVICCAGAWIAALPLSSTVQEAYLKRFHLASPSFGQWAVQQTIPSMYNFENKYWFSRQRVSKDELNEIANNETRVITKDPNAKIKSNMVNHFPTRVATFADERVHLKDDPRGFFYFRTRYRQKEIKTTYKLDPGTESEFSIRRVETVIE